MRYYFTKTVEGSVEEGVRKAEKALKKEGYGILTRIDVKKTLKKKLDEDFREYRILGACNPKFALKALKKEDKIGLMLPCNVVVQATKDGKTEIAAVDPMASMKAVENDKLGDVARQVREKLQKVIESI
ncbi:MAG: DUF302 domain-containing protein [Elusimicrobiota bacterium]